jgi:hypothetical protein
MQGGLPQEHKHSNRQDRQSTRWQRHGHPFPFPALLEDQPQSRMYEVYKKA